MAGASGCKARNPDTRRSLEAGEVGCQAASSIICILLWENHVVVITANTVFTFSFFIHFGKGSALGNIENTSRNDGGVASLPRAQGGFVSHVFMLITGNGVAQAINAAGALCVARLVAPDAFGMFALFVAVVSLVAVLGGGRYELGIMLPDDDEEAANILTLSTLVLLGIAAFSVIAVGVFHERLGHLLGDSQLSHWLWSMPLALFVIGFYQVLSYWSGRMKRFRDMATSRVYQALGILAGQLLSLTLHESGGVALVGGWIFGQSIGMLYLLVQILRNEGVFLAQAHDWSVIRESFSKYKNFPLYKAPYSFISNSSAQLVQMILQLFAGLDVVGFYSMASRAVYLPVGLIASPMNQVFYEKAATELRYGRMEQFVTRMLRVQIVLATPVLVLIAFDVKALFGFFLGSRWAAAGVYAAILAWIGYLSFLTSWLDRLFDVRGRQRLSLVLATAGNAIAIAGLFLALWYTRNTVLAVSAYAGLQVLYMGIWLCFAYRVAQFRLRSLVVLAKDALLAAVLAVTVIGAIHVALPLWLAVVLSAMAVLLMECIYFFRYVPRRAFVSTAVRIRNFWTERPNADEV